MATAGSKQGGGSSKPPAAAGQELDPRYEWEENASSFILRIHLSGFRKQDFRVQVDGAGRLTVRGQRSDAAANARHSRFNKVFQLPSTSNLDDIAGRFDLGVLTLTVPKRLPAPAKEDQQQAKKPEDAAAAAATKQVAGAKGAKPEPEQQPKEAAAKELDKPKAAAAAPAPAADTKKQPETQANAESKATDPTESLAERRTEEERANAAAAAERQRKACRGFKERVAEELQGLAGSEWAEGLVETVKRNREVIAVAVAAFSLGVFVSSRLFSRSSRN